MDCAAVEHADGSGHSGGPDGGQGADDGGDGGVGGQGSSARYVRVYIYIHLYISQATNHPNPIFPFRS